MRRWALWVLAAALLAPCAAPAQTIATSCTSYFASSADKPAEVAAFLADLHKRLEKAQRPEPALEKLALQKCLREGAASYTIQFPVEQNAGACRFLNMDASPMFSPDQTYLFEEGDQPPSKNSPPYQRMTLPDAVGACPDQSSKAYLSVQNVSPGVFRAVMTVWEKMRAAPQGARFYAALTPGDGESESALSSMIDMLQKAPDKIHACGLAFSAPMTRREPLAYELSACIHGGVFQIDFELMEAGMRVVRVSTMPN